MTAPLNQLNLQFALQLIIHAFHVNFYLLVTINNGLLCFAMKLLARITIVLIMLAPEMLPPQLPLASGRGASTFIKKKK